MISTRRAIFLNLVLVSQAYLCSPSPVHAQSILEAIKSACSKDLDAFCKAVTPGEGHIASCLYAHEDKISGKCAIAVYDGMIALQTSLTKLDFYTRVCRNDLLKHCATVEPGEGRIVGCLTANKAALNQDCAAALDSAKSELEKLGVVK